ncbi:hypothetical protein JCM24511_02447 [Saitozyma sp. JCM 24511]|nr:hypothetical protein JCM24511_02447 [Saitozyma sp. JCM 24511]
MASLIPIDMEPPPPDSDPSRCRLLGPTALVVQGLMGVFVIASLVAKRQLEKRKRKWKIWLWDVGKQLVGQAVVHGLNLLISDLVAHAADNNPCSLYFLNVLIDTTIGVAIFYFALKAFTWFFTQRLALEGYKSGQYGNPPNPTWWRQIIPYLLSIITMKLLVLLPLTLPGISELLLRFGHALLQYLSPSVQVVFVMALFPLVMNVIQFCLVDQVIKGGKGDEAKDEEEEEDGGYERVPTREADVEAGPAPRRRSSTKDGLVRRASSSQPGSVLTSPYLAPVDSAKRYGSISPSPSPRTSPRPSAEGSRSATWSGVLRETGDTLDTRDRRSMAPSPESTEPVSPASAMFASVSRLTEDAGREARRSLSPTTRAGHDRAVRESLGMERMEHE